MHPLEEFKNRNESFIQKAGSDKNFNDLTHKWFTQANLFEYSYHFTSLGRPIIQYPQDMVATQEIIWEVQPDLIIECGIAHGGSLIMSASVLALIDYCEAVKNGTVLHPLESKRKVIGIDIDIREHNRKAILDHPLAHKIEMFQGSSIEDSIIKQVKQASIGYKRILVFLDSNHTHDHVLAELEAYAPLTSKGSYCIVYDTVVEDVYDEEFSNRSWGKGNNPKTAVWEYLKRLKTEGRKAADGDDLNLASDKSIDNKLMISVAPDGYLRRV